MLFRQKSFWENIPKGTEIVLKKADSTEKQKLYFDEIREFKDYGIEMVYVCLQKDVKDLGNRSLTIPIVVDDIEDVVSIAGKTTKEYRKSEPKIKKEEEKNGLMEKVKKHIIKKESKPVEAEIVQKSEKRQPEPTNMAETEKASPVKSPRKRKTYDFEITEKDGKFYCPCGSAFGRRDTAIYVHRTRHLKS